MEWLPSFSPDASPEPGLSKKQNPPSVCGVCQGKASGYHYDAASCDSCKTFFRRVVIGNKKYICQFSDDCFDVSIPDATQKCRACRFRKCLKIGMKQWRVKYGENSMSDVENPLKTNDSQVADIIETLIRLDVQCENFRSCAYNPNSFPRLRECIKEKRSMLWIADKYGPMQDWPLHPNILKEFGELEQSLNDHHPTVKKWTCYDLLTHIELAKTLPVYSTLYESDRFYLARDTILMGVHLTRAFYSYAKQSDRLVRPDATNHYYLSSEFYNEFWISFRDDVSMRCLKTILRDGLDRVEFVLLRVLVLTTPGVRDLSEDAQKNLIEAREKYSEALFKYIMTKNGSAGPTRYVNILGIIDVLQHQQRDHRDLHNLVYLRLNRHCADVIVDDVMNR